MVGYQPYFKLYNKAKLCFMKPASDVRGGEEGWNKKDTKDELSN